MAAFCLALCSPTASRSATAPASGAQLSITVTPDPGYAGGFVTVDFVVQFYGASNISPVQFVVFPTLPAGMAATPMPAECTPVAGGGCALPGTYANPTTLTVPYTLSPTAAGTFPIVGRLQVTTITTEVARRPSAVAPRVLQPPVTALLTVLRPQISILPPVASPGRVVLVEGRDFPPGSAVGLRWRPGITAAAVAPVVGAGGTFTAQLLVLGGDQVGERSAVASGPGYTAAVAPFLVTPDRLMPPLLGAAG